MAQMMIILTTVALLFSFLASSTLADPARRLNPTRPKAFDYAADAEQVVGKLNDNFSCDGREYGYYADQGQQCQIFHICMPVKTVTGRILDTFQFSFFCPNQTRFSQDSRTCISEAQAFPCHKAHTLYDLNKAIGQRPNKKKRPVNLKEAIGGNHKFSSTGATKISSFSDVSGNDDATIISSSPKSSEHDFHSRGNTESLGVFAVQDGVTPVHTDSALNIGAPAVAVPALGETFGSTTNFAGRTQSSSSGIGASQDVLPFTQLSGNFEAPDPIIPPGSQIISTVSLNQQNALTQPIRKNDLPKNSGTSRINTSSRSTSGFSNSRSTQHQSLTSSVSPSTVKNNVNNSPSHFTVTKPNTQQSTLPTINDSELSKVDVTRQSTHTIRNNVLNSVGVNNRGSGSFATVPLHNNQDPSVVFRPVPQRNIQSSNTATSNEKLRLNIENQGTSHNNANDFSNSHSHKTTSIGNTNTFSSTGNIGQISTFASRARAQASFSTSNLSNKDASSQFSGQGSQAFSSSQNLGNSRTITTRQPVITAHKQITTAPQAFTVTKHPTLLNQQFTPPPIPPPNNSGPLTRLRIPGFSAGVIHTNEGFQSGTVNSLDNQKHFTSTSISTTTEHYLDDEEYQTTVTTETPLDFNKSGIQIDVGASQGLSQHSANKFTTQRNPSQVSPNNQRSRTQLSGTGSLNRQNLRTSVSGGSPNKQNRISNFNRSSNQQVSSLVGSTNNQRISNDQRTNSLSDINRSNSSSFRQNSDQHTPTVFSAAIGSANKQPSFTSSHLSHSSANQEIFASGFDESSVQQGSLLNTDTSLNKQKSDLSNLEQTSNQHASNVVGSTNNQRSSNKQRTNSLSNNHRSSSSSFSQNSNQHNVQVPSGSIESISNHASSKPSTFSHSSASNQAFASGFTESSIQQGSFGRVESGRQDSVSHSGNREILGASHNGISQNSRSRSSLSRVSAISTGTRASSTSSGSRKVPTSAGVRGLSGSVGSTRSSVSRGLRGQSTSEGGKESSSTLNRGQNFNSVSPTVSRDSTNRASSHSTHTTINRIPTRNITRNRGSKKFQPPTYLLQSSGFLNSHGGKTQNPNTFVRNNQVRSGSRTQALSSRRNNQDSIRSKTTSEIESKLTNTVRSTLAQEPNIRHSFDNAKISTATATQIVNSSPEGSNKIQSASFSTSQRSQKQDSQSQSDTQSSTNVSGSQHSLGLINSQTNSASGFDAHTSRKVPSVELSKINKETVTATNDEIIVAQVRPVNTRGRTFESRGASNLSSRNSLSASGNRRARGRSRGTTQSTFTTEESSTSQHKSSQTSSLSNLQVSRLNTPINRQRTTGATNTRRTSLQKQSFTSTNNQHRDTSPVSNSFGSDVENSTLQTHENIQTSGGRKVIKKKIIVNGRPGSRRNNEPNTASFKAGSQAATESEETKKQQQRAMDALARFNPKFANANLLAFRIIPNKPKSLESKSINIPVVSTTEVSQVQSSVASFGNQRKGNPRRINSRANPSYATTPPPQVRSRGISRRLSRPVTQRPVQIKSLPAPITTTVSPFQRIGSEGRRRITVQKEDESQINEPLSSSLGVSTSSSTDVINHPRGNTRSRNSVSHRRVLKKVTPISSNASNVKNSQKSLSASASNSQTSSTDFSAISSNSASRTSTRRTNRQPSTSTQSSDKPSGQLRVVGTSIKSSSSTSSSASTFNSQKSESSSSSLSRTTNHKSSKQDTIHEPLTDLELEALSALAQVNTVFGTARLKSQQVTSNEKPESNNNHGRTSTRRRNFSTQRSRSRSLYR